MERLWSRCRAHTPLRCFLRAVSSMTEDIEKEGDYRDDDLLAEMHNGVRERLKENKQVGKFVLIGA